MSFCRNITIVSPHIDDAILSLGGLIRNTTGAENRVSVQYVFSISDWVNPDSIDGAPPSTGQASITEIRKKEEALVCSELGYQYDFFDFMDLPLRKGEATSEMNGLIGDIKNKLEKTLHPSDDCFFPLGFGHPDHKVVNEIGLNLLARGYEVLFYEDLPYAAYGDYNYEERCSFLKQEGLEPVLVEINIGQKLKTLKLYASQMSEKWLTGIMNYAYCLSDNRFYERYWQPVNRKKYTGHVPD